MYDRKDAYYRQAKKEGYRSRAAYKLAQIAGKEKAVRSGDRVIDAGAAPGGWSQLLLELVGKGGKVAAVDLLPMDPLPGDNFRFWRRDLSDAALPAELLFFSAGGRTSSFRTPRRTPPEARSPTRRAPPTWSGPSSPSPG